jgi:hypothetical protein
MLVRITLIAALALPVLAPAEGLVELVDPLDEPERYCVDVPGWGRRLNLDAALMAHTCKPGAADELFTINRPAAGQLYMRAYDRCVAAESEEAGAEVFLKPCDSSPLQRFSFDGNGKIRLSAGKTCLAVAEGSGQPTGGPSHLRRDLTLELCESVAEAHSKWNLPASE